MLAKRRALILDGQEVARTPLLVPSFSSKGFPDVAKIVQYSSELIDDATLVSAYDLHYGKICPPFDFASLIFLDSGGYEAAKDTELSDFGDKEHNPRLWTQELYEKQLQNWHASVPTVVISYDHPKERFTIDQQIERAKLTQIDGPQILREILLKPETGAQNHLNMNNVLKSIDRLAVFDVIGVTEKEVGGSVLERMKNIAKLRRALDKAGLNTPIHVFGSLDTIATPMYFLAGADIFDGLTWLRFAFYEGLTVYKHNFGAIKFGVDSKVHATNIRCWHENYYYLKNLELEMRRYLNDYDIKAFKYHSDLFRSALDSVSEALKD